MSTPIPADNPARTVTLAGPGQDATLKHVALAGDVYTILLSGADTAGRYCLIDMAVPPGGGPPPHRHDFEEAFTVLAGTIDATCRGATTTVRAGETVNIPANAPHAFRNASDQPAQLLCLCAPAGQDEYFLRVGDLVPSRTSPPPKLDATAMAERKAKAEALAAEYRTEFVAQP